MYQNNYLSHQLRAASVDYDQQVFAHLPNGQTLSYVDLFASAEQLANVLSDKGLQPGDRLAVQVSKSISAIELYLATIMAGGVYLPLNSDYTPAEIEYFLNDANPSIFICSPESSGALTEIAHNAGVKSVMSLSADGQSGELMEQKALAPAHFETVERSADDLAAILYTSGTTGRSKGAMLSHAALASNANTLVDYWQFTADDCLIHALPIFHIHGLFVAINVTLCAGSSLHLLPQFNADTIIDKFSQATVLMGVPTFYVRLLKNPRLNPSVVANMRLFVSGSAPLLSETHQLWREKTGHDILERYGMTETNMNTSNPYDGQRKPGTVGFPLPGVSIKICNSSSGEELKDGEIGDIHVKGPNLFSGYWRMPEKTAEELSADGWFLTGDIGLKDSQGYVCIVGRSKDLIISGGYNVYPKEIESLIDDIEGVDESAVIGVNHPDFGEAVVALVVTTQADDELKELIELKTQSDLAKFKRPKRIFFVDQLPRNTMGKVQKAQLREQYSSIFLNI